MTFCPQISVYIPVYNAQAYVERAARSILEQTFRDFELILVDDGSTDHSLAILRKLEALDGRVKVISRPNTGVSGAANDAIAASRCELIARMDADDIALPDRLEKQYAYMQAHPEVVLLGSEVLLIDPCGSPLYKPKHYFDHADIEREMLKGVGWAVAQPTSILRKSAFSQVGGYRLDRVPSEDLDLFLRLAEIGKIANLPEVLLHYRQHPRSANHTRSDEQNALKGPLLREAHARRGLSLPADWVPPRRELPPLAKEVTDWGWSALKQGNVSAARNHAWALVKMAPFSVNSWRLVFCAFRGH